MDCPTGRPSRRQFVQDVGVASATLLAGCGRLPFQPSDDQLRDLVSVESYRLYIA